LFVAHAWLHQHVLNDQLLTSKKILLTINCIFIVTIVGLVLAAIQGLPEPAGSRSELDLIRTE